MSDSTGSIVDFLNRLNEALGVSSPIEIEDSEEGARLNMTGEEAEILVRHRGEALKALQHVVDMAFCRDERRVFIDALGYRRGKDMELKQMARFLANKAKDTGVDQQLGPLNPYERRLVHMAAAEVPGVSTESSGDAFTKTVTISARR
ncbi:MAG: protein jag [Vicinamibacterales bacterium]